MTPVAEDTANTEGAQKAPDNRIEIIGGIRVPPDTAQIVLNGLRRLLPVEVPKEAKKKDDKNADAAEPATSWMANNPTDLAAAWELFYNAQANYLLSMHVDRLQEVGLIPQPPQDEDNDTGSRQDEDDNVEPPSPMHVRVIILTALYLNAKGELRLRDPRLPAPAA